MEQKETSGAARGPEGGASRCAEATSTSNNNELVVLWEDERRDWRELKDKEERVGRPTPTVGAKRKEEAPQGSTCPPKRMREQAKGEQHKEGGGKEEGTKNHRGGNPCTSGDIRNHFLPSLKPGSHMGANQNLAPHSNSKTTPLPSKASTKSMVDGWLTEGLMSGSGVTTPMVSGLMSEGSGGAMEGLHRRCLAIEWDTRRLGILAIQWEGSERGEALNTRAMMSTNMVEQP